MNNGNIEAPARYGPAGRDPAERPPGDKPWIITETMPSGWVALYANADPSGIEDDDVEAADRAEAAYVADGYTFSGVTYGPHDSIESTDSEGRPLESQVSEGIHDGMFGNMQTLVWANSQVLEADLAAGRRPHHIDGTEYLLDATSEKTAWLPGCWWRLIEHGEWKASDFEDDEEEEHWGRDGAREALTTLFHEGWTPVRRLGNGYVERNERFHGYSGKLTLYLLRSGQGPRLVPPIERDE